MTIYIDVIILENLIMNYIILYATTIVSKTKVGQIRIILSSMIGTIYLVISFVSQMQIYSSIFLKIVLSIVMVYIAFRPQDIKKLLKHLVMFYLVSFVFGGAVLSLLYFIKPQELIMKDGLFLGTYPLKTVFLGGIVGFIIIKIAIRLIKIKFSKTDMIYNLQITLNDKEIKTKGMLDTGNLLKEPITNTPVIIVEHTLLYDSLPKEILNNLNNILSGDFANVPKEIEDEYAYKLKIIPFASLGKENGMLVGIKADKVIVQNEELEKKIDKVIIGIYNKSLTKRGEYRALIGIDMI